MTDCNSQGRRRKERFLSDQHQLDEKAKLEADGFERERAAWADHAEQLADWGCKRFINRDDRVLRYLSESERSDNCKVIAATRPLSIADLISHFTCSDRSKIQIAYAIAPDNTCRWGAIDIDAHGDYDEDRAKSNLVAAETIAEELRRRNFTTLVFDSDGNGGFHVVVFFAEPLPSVDVNYLLCSLTEDWYRFGLAERPETFPKQAELTEKVPVGNGLRLPGLHHSRDFITRIWTNGKWLAGQSAVQYLLETVPGFGTDIRRQTLSKDAVSTVKGRGSRSLRNISLPQNAVDDHLPLIERVLSRLKKMGKEPDGCNGEYSARCPAHHDRRPSLSIRACNDGKVLIFCHAGCGFESIAYSIGLELRELASGGQGRLALPASASGKLNEAPDPEFAQRATEYEDALQRHHVEHLSKLLTVPPHALKALHIGWHAERQCWTFPERNHLEVVIGIQLRFEDGRKSFLKGGKRGLILPDGWRNGPGPLFIPEGASDIAAFIRVGHSAIGRPSATDGGEYLVSILKNDAREIVVVGENDEKDGKWPGKAGAERLAILLKAELGRDVAVRMPRKQFKDVRAGLKGEVQ
ncbi:MAG: hypothetical protein HQ518_17660 [Rhodopirellula sp.]|nr:hypothetical protein [Rhodopirellula sp.]